MFKFAAKGYTNPTIFVVDVEENLLEPVKIKIKPKIFLAALMFVFANPSYTTNKINIIKQVRDSTGTGLKDAKDAVEAAYEALEQIDWSIFRFYPEYILPVAKMIK